MTPIKGEEYLVKIPCDSYITFGPFAPRGHYDTERTIRVYADKKKEVQLACFPGVRSFRDMSVTVSGIQARKVVSV